MHGRQPPGSRDAGRPVLIARAGPGAILAGLVALAWPVASHGVAVLGRPDLMPALTAVMAGVLLLFASLRTGSPLLRTVLFVSIVLVCALWWLAPRLLLFVTPAAITAAAGMWFAVSLAPGREPRIATYARHEHGGELPAEVARYARRLTALWALLLFASAILSVSLALLAPLATWSAWTNAGSYVVIAAFFVAEYLWRRVRFPQRRHVSFMAHLRNVMRR